MDNENLAEQLRSLPPDLPDQPGRFDSVRKRAQRTHQRHVGGAVLGGVAALAIALPVAQQFWPETAAPAVPADNSQSTEESAQNTAFPWPDGVAREGLMPGLTVDTSYSKPVTTTHTGTATVELGPRPPQTEAVTMKLECLSGGTLTWPDGVARTCDGEDSVSMSSLATDFQLPLDPGQENVVIEAGEGTRWRITTSYAISDATEWKTNANGQTYGVPNRTGTPDLVMVLTTGGEAGWAYADDIDAVGGFETQPPTDTDSQPGPTAEKDTKVPAYKSDGSTLIGEFQTQPEEAPTLLPTP